MKYHVQNPWTRGKQLFVHLTEEEVMQLHNGIAEVLKCYERGVPPTELSANERAAMSDLVGHLKHACNTPRPQGLK